MSDIASRPINLLSSRAGSAWMDLIRVPSAWLLPWLIPFLLLALWELGSRLGFIRPEYLPPPSQVIAAGTTLTTSGELTDHLLISFRRAMTGFLVGGALAFALGIANGVSRLSERLTDTTFQMVRNIPSLALIPLVILWFGIDEGAKLFLTAFGVFFPIYINTLHGVKTVDIQLIEMAKSYGIGRWGLFRKVIFPGALPSIFIGIRYALGIMWLTLIVSETIAANSGIGYMAMQAREFMLVDVVIVAILLYALLGKVADATARSLEKLALSWHPAYGR